MSTPTQTARSPRFSIVTAVYDVGRFLPDFIRSMEAQTIDDDELEFVMVDDGSTDDSLQVLEEWAARRPEVVRVVTKENGGQGSARNLGMTLATGTWITFLDPDDWVNDVYFERLAAFDDRHPDADMMASHRLLFEEARGEVNDNHPLKQMFTKDQLVDINNHTEYFHGSAPAAFVRRSVVASNGLEYDTRIRPNFEDGHFCTKYLLLFDRPKVGFIRTAEYYYRKRADQSSTLQSSVAQTGRFREVPEFGYLDVLETAIERFGTPPIWLQNMILYELSWYFSSEDLPSNSISAADGDIGEGFVALLRRIVPLLEESAIRSFSLRKYKPEWRNIMLHALRSQETWHTDYVILQQYDQARKLVEIAFRFIGDMPEVEYLVGGNAVSPQHAKTRTFVYFGVPLLYERVGWIPHDGTVRVRIDGTDVELRTEWRNDTKVTSLWPSRLRRKFVPASVPGRRTRLRAKVRHYAEPLTDSALLDKKVRLKLRVRLEEPLLRRVARLPIVRRHFANAWVLLDRIHECNDSAEVLFRYLRRERPDVNAWFALEKGTPDWDRMRADGLDHMLAHGSLRWKLLMLNCDDLISSHADVPIVRPPAIMRLRDPDWRFTFLQHGVIKDDLSKWLNAKQIDTFITSTQAEYDSIAGDGTSYVFTSREVQLTGLPRFDALYEAAQKIDRKDTVLIAPTWRHWLNEPLASGVQKRTLVDGFSETEFAVRWNDLLQSGRLQELATEGDLDIVFLPHPNLEPALPYFHVPKNVTIGSYSDPDLHTLYARTSTLITDFSSAAFNCAFLGQQTIYYFFDHDLVMAGGHVGRRGYFDYHRDGFGPLVDDADAVLDELAKHIANDGHPSSPYAERIKQAFPHRDGRCSERVTAAIEAAAFSG